MTAPSKALGRFLTARLFQREPGIYDELPAHDIEALGSAAGLGVAVHPLTRQRGLERFRLTSAPSG